MKETADKFGLCVVSTRLEARERLYLWLADFIHAAHVKSSTHPATLFGDLYRCGDGFSREHWPLLDAEREFVAVQLVTTAVSISEVGKVGDHLRQTYQLLRDGLTEKERRVLDMRLRLSDP